MWCVNARISNYKPMFRRNLPLLKVESIFCVMSLESVGSTSAGKHGLILSLAKGLSCLSPVWGPEFGLACTGIGSFRTPHILERIG